MLWLKFKVIGRLLKKKRSRIKAQMEVDKVIREEEESRRKADELAKQEEIEKKRKLREDRMEERMKKRGDTFQDSGLFDEDPILEEVTQEETVMNMQEETVAEETVGEEIVSNNEESKNQHSYADATISTTSNPLIIEKPAIPPGNYFKLGQEGSYKQYVNQYTTVQHALSRNQAKEEIEKKTRLSHKFSLTDAST